MEKYIKNFKTWVNLNEGGGEIISALDKFFTKTVTTKLATKLDGYQRKQLDDVFALIAKNEINFIKNAEGTFIKSSTGVHIPVSKLEKGLTAVIDGKLTVDEFIAMLPAKLADGTEVKTVVQKATAGNVSKNVSKNVSTNLVKYSTKMHDAFLRFERSLTSNRTTKELWDFKFFNYKNRGLQSIKDIEQNYVMAAHGDQDYVLTQKEAKELVDALSDKLKPEVLAKWKPSPGEIQAPTSGIGDLMNHIKQVWGL